ncbi:MAG: DUF4404 family protein [Pirellulales bacterium]
MKKQRLLKELDQLKAELSKTESADPQTVARLEKAIDDVQRALDACDERSAAELEPISGLKDLLLKFEAEHPQLATTIGRVADALAALGI